MRRLGHHGSSPHDDIEDAEFVEVRDKRQTPPPPPPPPPTLGDWWAYQGFFIKALIAIVPLFFLAMCMAAISDPEPAATNPAAAGEATQEAVSNSLAVEDTMPVQDTAELGQPTCFSIETDVKRLFERNSTKAIIEINNTKSEIVDGNPRCYASVLTEAGTVFLTYGTEVTQKGQLYVYVRPTADIVVPPGMENMPILGAETPGRYEPPAASSPERPAELSTPAPTVQPSPIASLSPTDEDVFAPHP